MPLRPPLTHFLCLPLVASSSKPQLLASLQYFATDVADPEHGYSATIPAKAIRPVGTLHLTLGVMSLQTPERVVAASDFLRSLNIPNILHGASKLEKSDPSNLPNAEDGADLLPGINVDSETTSPEAVAPLRVTLSGLHPMHVPSSTSILYASPADSTSRLHPFCLALQHSFAQAGYLLSDDRDLCLHATVVNTIYVKDKKARAKGNGHGKNSKGSRKFDAREIIDKYGDYQWAKDVRIERVSICEMGAKKIIEDGGLTDEEYLEVASVPLT